MVYTEVLVLNTICSSIAEKICLSIDFEIQNFEFLSDLECLYH
jgi:hypothetical protein